MDTLVDLFKSFSSQGERTAFIHRTGVRRRVMSYGMLVDQSLRMASLLATIGIVEGDRVLLWGANSSWWGVAFWGCIVRGAIVVPVDVMAGTGRAAAIAAHTGAVLVLQSRSKEPLSGCRSIIFEDLPYLLSAAAPSATIDQPDAVSTAQLIYTSGTTGAPKGVILTHANLIANLIQVNRHITVVTKEFRFLSCLPLSHMFEQMGGFFTPLLKGASIVYLQTLKPSALMAAFAEEEISAVIVVPRLLQLLRNSVERELAAKGVGTVFTRILSQGDRIPAACRRLLFAPVRRKFGESFVLFVSGGAALSPELFRFWSGMGFRVIEGYGLSECSPVLTANSFDCQVAGSAGIPLPGVSIRLEDGELLARGNNIFPGYYQNEEATRQAFTADGWFRTGDLGEIDSRGFVHIKGRRKEMIVTGAGVNVYPDEVEGLTASIPGVRELCVVGLDRGNGEEVHAVLIPDGSGRPAAEIIREANGRLDDLQQITGFTVWPDAEFPKTTTLKIQKFLVVQRLKEERGGSGEESPVDRMMAIVAKATSCTPEQAVDSAHLMADLGLTSIGRLELVNALEQEFRLDLDDTLIGPQTTVGNLREMVSSRAGSRSRQRFRFWANSWPVKGIRRFCDAVIHFPLLGTFVALEVRGRERLADITQPVLFIANHLSYLDQPVIMRSIPPHWRYNTATAVWAEFFFRNFRNIFQQAWKRFTYEYGTLALNLFPLPQSQGFRSSLEHMGRLVDRGINLLVFPEGERSLTGELLPFQQGLGIMVKELDIPVVPIKITGLEYVYPRGAIWPKRGRVVVTIGEPLVFGKESPAGIVEQARRAVEGL